MFLFFFMWFTLLLQCCCLDGQYELVSLSGKDAFFRSDVFIALVMSWAHQLPPTISQEPYTPLLSLDFILVSCAQTHSAEFYIGC